MQVTTLAMHEQLSADWTCLIPVHAIDMRQSLWTLPQQKVLPFVGK